MIYIFERVKKELRNIINYSISIIIISKFIMFVWLSFFTIMKIIKIEIYYVIFYFLNCIITDK